MWKLQSNYFPPRFHVRVPWGMKNVYGRPPKRFSFLYVLGTKISKAYTKLKRFIKIYLSLFHYTLNSKIWKLFTYYPIECHFPNTHENSQNQIDVQRSKLVSSFHLRPFFTTFFSLQLGNVCSSIAVLS